MASFSNSQTICPKMVGLSAPVSLRRRPSQLLILLLSLGSIGWLVPSAIAQTTTPNVPFRNPDGSVIVDNNARDIRTGPLQNGSNIPLPSELPAQTTNRVPIAVDRSQLAPNSIIISPDLPYIQQSFEDLINAGLPENERYTLQRESVQLTTTFDLARSVGNHRFAEGVQVTIVRADGQRIEQPAVFVRGGGVTIGPDGQALPNTVSESATYGEGDTVEIRVLHIRTDGGVPEDSGIYFTQDFRSDGNVGEFIVEDSTNGGDLDFDDGEFVDAPTGEGQGVAVFQQGDIVVTTETVRTPLDPLVEQDVIEADAVAGQVPQTDVQEVEISRVRGQVELPEETTSNRLGHATGIRTEDDEQLVYNRYSGASEVRLGSDGLGVTGQLPPLVGNPSAPPTLLTGNLRFDPTVDDNEAGLTATIGLTQFLTRTHRPARDIFGQEIIALNEDGDEDNPRLLEPVGLFNNRQWVGYVPSTPIGTEPGDAISSVNGVFDLPADQAVEIAPPDPQQVGRGNADYTDNVGGLLIESPEGTLSFVPQWTKAGYAQESLSLAAGEASRVIYALVPQQPGQALQLGQTYPVIEAATGLVIADGGFTLISADRQPQNFSQEMSEVYAVEDTLPEANAQTSEFNGIQGNYAEVTGGPRIPTVDVTIADEADARVGNDFFRLTQLVDLGQSGYMRTTRAGGFYLGGQLTGGFGNQQDTVVNSQITTVVAADALIRQRTINTFSTPRVQVDTITTENGTVTQTTGIALFEVNGAGELFNPSFLPGPVGPVTVNLENNAPTTVSTIETGARALVSSVVEEDILDGDVVQSDGAEVISRDEAIVTDRDSYPNFSAVRGELGLGAVYNFGNTPWTVAANTMRAELFYRDTVFGQSTNDSQTGIRAEVVFHPFGEVRRDAYQYDEAGNVVPVYQTEPMLDANGDQMMETLTDDEGNTAQVRVNQFVLDETTGDRILQRVGTGKARGPGAYVRIENVFDDGTEIAGGLQLSF
ncbi:MAG: hypothetical protein WA783_07375 [Phormidesmis sp.]